MKGSRTPAEVEAKFRRLYLKLGNASEAARRLKLPESTGSVLARRALQDKKFVEARNHLYTHGLDEVEALMLDATRAVHRRILEKPLSPEDIAKLQQEYDLKSFHFQDPRPQYYGQLVNAHRSLVARKKAAETSSEKREPVTVTVRLESPDNEPGPTAEPSSVEGDPGDKT